MTQLSLCYLTSSFYCFSSFPLAVAVSFEMNNKNLVKPCHHS